MKRYGAILGIAVIAAGCSSSRPDVALVEQTRVEALLNNDVEALAELTADEFIHVNSEGTVRGKSEFLSGRRSGERSFSLFENEEVDIQYFDDTAVVLGRYRNAFAASASGNAKEARFVRVYVLRDGRWQNVVHQATEIASPLRSR